MTCVFGDLGACASPDVRVDFVTHADPREITCYRDAAARVRWYIMIFFRRLLQNALGQRARVHSHFGDIAVVCAMLTDAACARLPG